MLVKPQPEHAWLDQLLGEWTVESECQSEPGKPPEKTTSQMVCRSLKGMWVICEGEGSSPESGDWHAVMTLGYDPGAKNYVGTFITNMMAELWVYSGILDESGKKLVLECEGPKMDGTGKTKYQDIIEIVNKEYWIFSTQMLDNQGGWIQFATAHYHRKT